MSQSFLDIVIRGTATQFGKVAQETTRQINGIKSAVTAIPADAIRGLGTSLVAFLSVDFVTRQIASVVRYGGEITNLSNRIGVATDFLQAAEFAAGKFGASLDQVVVGLRELQRSSASAIANPKGQDAAAFRGLGIDPRQLKGMSVETVFREVANALSDGAVSGQKLNQAMVLMGQSGAALLPMLRSGFAALEEEAKSAGVVIDREIIAKLDDVGSRWSKIALQFRAGFAGAASMAMDVIEVGQKIGASIVGVVKSLWDLPGNSQREGKIFSALSDAVAAAKKPWQEKVVGNDGPINGPIEPEVFRAQNRANAGAKANSLAPGAPNSDALQRIGLFISGSSQAQVQAKHLMVAERALEEQRALLREIRNRL